MSVRQPVIVFALFPGVTQLDFTRPHEVFSSLPGARVIMARVRERISSMAAQGTEGIELAAARLTAS
jgi:hypothetical protein